MRRLMRGEVVLLVAITLALGAPGGAPWYHPDSIIVRAMHVLAHGGDPNFFHYPGFVIYADALLYGVVYAGLAASHSVAGMAAFQQCFAAGVFPNGMPFDVPALILTYAFSAAGIVLTNRLAWELSGDRALAFIAALIPATSLLWGVETHFTTVDLPMTTLVLATLLATVRATRAGAPMSRRQLAMVGLLLGLSVSAKYTAVLVAIPVLAAVSACDGAGARRRSDLGFLSGVAGLAFLATNPFAFVKPVLFLHDSFDEVSHGMRGHFGWQHDQGYLYHLQVSLLDGIGVPFLLLAAIGAFAFASSTLVPRPAKRAILLFPLVYYGIVGGSKLSFQRYMLPMLPFVGLFAAWGLHALASRVAHHVPRPRLLLATMFALTLGLAFPNVMNVVAHDRLLMRPDTRAGLRALFASAPELAHRSVFGGSYVQTAVATPVSLSWDSLGTKLPDVLVLDSFSHDRYLYDPRRSQRFGVHRSDFATAHVLTLTPFRLVKGAVPFSAQSVYSPYLPDLRYREAAGPYIELYVREDSLAVHLRARALAAGVACTFSEAARGYYFQNFEE